MMVFQNIFLNNKPTYELTINSW